MSKTHFVKILITDNLQNAFEQLTTTLRNFVIPLPTTSAGNSDGTTMYQALSSAAITAMSDWIEQGNALTTDEVNHLIDTYYQPRQTYKQGSDTQDNLVVVAIKEDTLDKINHIGEYLHTLDLHTDLKPKRGEWKRTLIIAISVGWLYETFDERLAVWAKQRRS